MSMERFVPKKEAMVPDNQQESFAEAAEKGKQYAEKATELEKGVSHANRIADSLKTTSKGFSDSADELSKSNNPLNIGSPIGDRLGALVFGGVGKLMKKAGELDARDAEQFRRKSEMAYDESREIVKEGMLEGGAQEADGRILATPDQIKAAQQEMRNARKNEWK
ncbi:MAG: hypothetical protein PHV99_03545 [Candidatus Pacebacteria bacterium]|nr:hypothetical protein [Candidatus Paceibacterota bacterium]